MSSNEFLKWTTSDVDFYALLGLTLESVSASELRRAYRKTALKYHPDKVGKDFDPDKYELFQAANEVLSDPSLKEKYDAHRNAKLQKQRANDLFEGKRRAMKEDLEAREKAGGTTTFGVQGIKRPRSEDEDIRKMAELGRQKRMETEMARKSMMAETAVPTPKPTIPTPKPEEEEEDDIARLERKILEAQSAKAKRKSERAARKSDVSSVPAYTPIKRPNIFGGLKTTESPKFSFSPSIATPKRGDFAATMARLRNANAEKQRLEEQIRKEDADEI